MTKVLRVAISTVAGLAIGTLVLTFFLRLSGFQPANKVDIASDEIRVRDASLFDEEQQAAQCVAREAAVWNAIDDARTCSLDADCQLVSLGCPFGCLTSINRGQAESVRALAEEFHAATRLPGCGQCVYSCLDREVIAKCIDFRCSIAEPSSDMPPPISVDSAEH